MFVRESISRKSPVPVRVISHAVEVRDIKKVSRDHFALQENEYVFLFIFDFLSYFERKNPLAVVRAFKRAFSPRENVRLVIKCTNSTFDPGKFARIKKEAEGAKADIIDRYYYRDEVNALLFHCDAYVSLHRSEGFGLTMAESMYLGKPVIATNYSGNLDYMNANNSYLVNCKISEISKDAGPYAKGNVWAEPDIGHAAELMRHVYKNQAQARAKGDVAASDIRKCLSHSKIGKDMKNRIDQIAS